MAYTVTVLLIGLPSFVIVEEASQLPETFASFVEAFAAGTANITTLGRPSGGAVMMIQDEDGRTVSKPPASGA